MTQSWELKVMQAEDSSDDLILTFPPELLDKVGWKEGDDIEWLENPDGSYTLTKAEETEWVMVEALSQFKVTYMVEVPKGKAEYALDTVAMENAKEFSQEHLLPTDIIINHRVVSQEEALALCDERNGYCSSWDDELKIASFFTTWKEQQSD